MTRIQTLLIGLAAGAALALPFGLFGLEHRDHQGPAVISRQS